MFIRILTFLIFLGCFYLLLRSQWIWKLNQARRKGLYPDRSKTMFDVRRLVIKGEKELAIQTYREIFQTSRKEAQEAVEQLAKSIQGKDSQID